MKNFKMTSMNLILAVSLVLTSTVAHAREGGDSSGGGGAYVCRDAEGKIKSAHLVDLWEGANVPFRWPHLKKAGKIKINLDNDSFAEEQFQKALARLAEMDADVAEKVREAREELFADPNVLEDDVSIALPDDLKAGYFPTGCEPEGMMYYNGDTQTLDIRKDIFDALKTKTDIASAWMHEALYKVMRGAHPEYMRNSIKARRLNACLFSSDRACLSEGRSSFDRSKARRFKCSTETVEFDFFAILPGAESVTSDSNVVVFNKLGTRKLGYKYMASFNIEYDGHSRYALMMDKSNPFTAYDPATGLAAASPFGTHVKFRMESGVANWRTDDFKLEVLEITDSATGKDSYLPYGKETGTCRYVP